MKDKVQLSLVTTAQNMTGGTDALQGIGEDYTVTIGTTYNGLSFNMGDLVTLILTDQGTGYQTQVGAGDVTGIEFNYCLTYNNKVYGLSGGKVYCCAVGQPTVWNNPNGLGNGFVKLSNWYAGTDTLAAMAPFQGKMAFFSRTSTQIWALDSNVDNWQIVQILRNVGTTSPMSVCGLGELDVLLLNDSGFRSLQVRYADLNASANDIGSPIDTFVQAAMLALTDAQKALCCGIVGAGQNRYWCFIPNAAMTGGYIYVLSYYPANKIIAWTRYTPQYDVPTTSNMVSGNNTVVPGRLYTYHAGDLAVSLTVSGVIIPDGGTFTPAVGVTTVAYIALAGPPSVQSTLAYIVQTSFVPKKFVLYNGQVYATDGTNYYAYGGADGNTYDTTQAVMQLPFYDYKSPGTQKYTTAVDVDVTGSWEVYGSPQWIDNTFQDIGLAGTATFDNGMIGYEDKGSHFTFKFVSTGSTAAVVSGAILYYNPAETN